MTFIDKGFFDKLHSVSLKVEPSFGQPLNREYDLDINSEPLPPVYNSARKLHFAFEPSCDVQPTSKRLPLHPFDERKNLVPTASFSLALHCGLALFWFYGEEFHFFASDEKQEVVEVTFGVEVPGRFVAPPPSKEKSEKPLEQEQATKAPEQLPQLPQRFEVKTKAPESQDQDMASPDAPAQPEKIRELKEPTLPLPPKTESVVTPKPEPDKKAIVAPEQDKDAQKIDINEVIDRMKKEDRKVGEKDKVGQKNVPEKVSENGLKIPDNPLSDPLNPPLPDMPNTIDSATPSGSLAGRKLAGSALEAYKTAALVHMKRYWNIPGLVEFAPDLITRAVVVLDLFGKIQSLEIDRSSGNQSFDELVLKQIKLAEPFPDFPAGSGRTEKVYMLFKPKTID